MDDAVTHFLAATESADVDAMMETLAPDAELVSPTGDMRMALGEVKIGPLKMGDAMVFELAQDGRIARVRPHLRPWLALTLFALMLGPKVARDPGVVRRALSA